MACVITRRTHTHTHTHRRFCIIYKRREHKIFFCNIIPKTFPRHEKLGLSVNVRYFRMRHKLYMHWYGGRKGEVYEYVHIHLDEDDDEVFTWDIEWRFKLITTTTTMAKKSQKRDNIVYHSVPVAATTKTKLHW